MAADSDHSRHEISQSKDRSSEAEVKLRTEFVLADFEHSYRGCSGE